MISKTLALMAAAFALGAVCPAHAKVNVVCSLSTYASLAEEVGGGKVSVSYICKGNEDAHFVKPKPSYSVAMKNADLLVSTGLDLELWLPSLIDRSGNRNLRSGQKGYVKAAEGITMLEKPEGRPDRSQGDIHIFGNPHIQTSPLNAKIIAGNICIGLKKVDSGNAAYYEARLKSFQNRIDEALFGATLTKLLGGDVLTRLLAQHKLHSFLESKKLTGKLGGWLKEAKPLRGKPLVGYHMNWVYFADVFGLNMVGYIEPKPGIPPTPAHVNEVIQTVKKYNVKAILTANYFEKSKPEMVASKTGAKAVIVPMGVGGAPGVNDYFDLVNCWLKGLRAVM